MANVIIGAKFSDNFNKLDNLLKSSKENLQDINKEAAKTTFNEAHQAVRGINEELSSIREKQKNLSKESQTYLNLEKQKNQLTYQRRKALEEEETIVNLLTNSRNKELQTLGKFLNKSLEQIKVEQKIENGINSSNRARERSIELGKQQLQQQKEMENKSKRLNEILLKMQSLSRMMSDQEFAGKTGKKGKTPLDMSWAIDQYKELRLEAEGIISVLGEGSEAAQHFRNGMAWTEANNPLRALRDEATKLIPKIASAEAELKKLSIDPSKNAGQIKAIQEQLNTWKESYGEAITEFQNQINRIKEDKSGIFTENDIKILESSKQVLIDQLQTLTEIKVTKQEGRNEDILTEQEYKALKAELQERFALEEKLAKLQQNPSKHIEEIKALKQILAEKRTQEDIEKEINKLPSTYRNELNKIIAAQKEQRKIAQEHNEDLKQSNKSLGESLTNFMKFTAYYFVLQKMKQLVNEMLDTMKELDKAFTNIQMVTGDTDEQTAQLANDYNQLARELGATTTEVAEGAAEWFNESRDHLKLFELLETRKD